MNNEKKNNERKFESASQDFLEMELVSFEKRSRKPEKEHQGPQIKPVDNQFDIVNKLIKFLKD